MNIEGSLNDYPLLDLIAILSRRGDSGRLQIDFGSAQGFLYFQKGKIAGAHMCRLNGFSAVNLVISLQGTRFCFDPLVKVPTSEFNNPNEELLLRKLLGSEVVAPGSALNLSDFSDSSIPAEIRPRVAPALLEPSLTETSAADSRKKFLLAWQSFQTFVQHSKAYTTKGWQSFRSFVQQLYAYTTERWQSFRSIVGRLGAYSTQRWGSFRSIVGRLEAYSTQRRRSFRGIVQQSEAYATQGWRSLSNLVQRSGPYVTPQRLAVAVASILFVVLATVGIAVFWNKSNQSATLNVPPDVAAMAFSRRSDAATVAQGEDKRIALSVPNANSTPAVPKRSLPEGKVTPNNESRDFSAASAEVTRRGKTKALAENSVDGESFEETRKPAKIAFRVIPVVIRIEDGHVAEAYIQKRQAGSEAYEATALRLARQRRFPKDTIRVETIVVQVANER